LSGSDLVALMVDGVRFAEHTCVVALGIGIDGTKHPLALVEGSTENSTLVTELCVDPRERGLDVTRPILVVLEGSKALRRAVLDVFDHPVLARCQLDKIRNVSDKLPQRMRSTAGKKLRIAYHADSALDAQAQLEALARELDKTHPSAAASLREGLAETLTVLRPGCHPRWNARCAARTPSESMISICRDHARSVKRWRVGQMALRWCAAGMVEAGNQFRRISGHLHLTALREALEAEVTQAVRTSRHDETGTQPDDHRAATGVPWNSGHPRRHC
jgi:putative transposase